MKITRKNLEKLIKEELAKILQEDPVPEPEATGLSDRYVMVASEFDAFLEALTVARQTAVAENKWIFKSLAKQFRDAFEPVGRETDVALPPAGSGTPVNMKVTGGTSP